MLGTRWILFALAAFCLVRTGGGQTPRLRYAGSFFPGDSWATEGDSIATDNSGAAYITGAGSTSSFIRKAASNGAVVYEKTIAGKAYGIAVDAAGCAYVIATGLAGGLHVMKFSASGDEILYETSLPFYDTSSPRARAIAVDALGNAYITGSTASPNFPVTPGALQTKLLRRDAFILKLDSDGHIAYATYLGGSGDDEGRAIAVDAAGQAYITGAVDSMDFPVTTGAAQPRPGGAFVYRSDNGGQDWSRTGPGIMGPVSLLAVDPLDASHVFAPLVKGGLWVSHDAGEHWTAIGVGLGTDPIRAIAFDPTNTGTIYAVDGRQAYKSSDSGETWTSLGKAGTDPNDLGPWVIAVDPTNPAILYSGKYKLTKSIDGGRTWQVLSPPFLGPLVQIGIKPSVPLAIYAATSYDGFKMSLDGGLTWVATAMRGDSYFALSPSRPSTLYWQQYNNLYRTDDAGANWNRVGPSVPGSNRVRLATSPIDPELVYAWGLTTGGAPSAGDLFSHSGNATEWRRLTAPLSGEISPDWDAAFAVAPSSPQRLYYGASPGWDAFVAKISADGSKLLYSTYLGGMSGDYGFGIDVDASGNAYVAGATASADLPATNGAAQTAFGGGTKLLIDARDSYGGSVYPRGTDAFVAKLDPTGSRFLYLSYLGGTSADAAFSVAVDASGKAVVAGQTYCGDFPTSGGGRSWYTLNPTTFLSQFSADGSTLLYSDCFTGNAGTAATSVALDLNGRAYLTGRSNPGLTPTVGASAGYGPFLLIFQLNAATGPVVSKGGALDVFSYKSAIGSPGAAMSIFGARMADSAVSASGYPLPTALNGVSVSIDGIDAPLYYAGANQINLQIPWEVQPGISQMILKNAAGASAPVALPVEAAAPSFVIDWSTGWPYVFNQDGSLNSAGHPAPSGSTVTLYLTGLGLVSNQPPNGSPAPYSPLARASQSAYAILEAVSGPTQLPLDYVGLAPGYVGLAQVNLRLPDGVEPGDRRVRLVIEAAGKEFVSDPAFIKVGAPKG